MLNRPDPEAGQPIRRGVSISIQPLERRDKLRRSQTVEKPFLKVKLHKREKEKFWSSLFYVVNMFTTACRISIP